MMRLVGILLISGGIAMGGFLLARVASQEERELGEGISFLKQMASRFDYLGEEFSVLFCEASAANASQVSQLFYRVGQRLSTENTDGASIWRQEVLYAHEHSYLARERIDSLMGLLVLFSGVSKEEQSMAFHSLIHQWELWQGELHGEAEKKSRLYQTLGLCLAAFFAILFF